MNGEMSEKLMTPSRLMSPSKIGASAKEMSSTAKSLPTNCEVVFTSSMKAMSVSDSQSRVVSCHSPLLLGVVKAGPTSIELMHNCSPALLNQVEVHNPNSYRVSGRTETVCDQTTLSESVLPFAASINPLPVVLSVYDVALG